MNTNHFNKNVTLIAIDLSQSPFSKVFKGLKGKAYIRQKLKPLNKRFVLAFLACLFLFSSLIGQSDNLQFTEVIMPEGKNALSSTLHWNNEGILFTVVGRGYYRYFYMSKDRGESWQLQSEIPNYDSHIKLFNRGEELLRVEHLLGLKTYISNDLGKKWRDGSDIPEGYTACGYVDGNTKICGINNKNPRLFEYDCDNGKWIPQQPVYSASVNLNPRVTAAGGEAYIACDDCFYKPQFIKHNYGYATFKEGGTLYCWKRSDLWQSENHGKSWKELTLPEDVRMILSFVCLTPSLQVLSTYNGSYISFDKGEKWEKFTVQDMYEVRGVFGISPDGYLYLIASDDKGGTKIFRSSDAIGYRE